MNQLLLGDCLAVLREMEDNSVDSIVTDPPYGISFMSRKWDYDVPSVEIWAECLRVLKSGGHLLSFAGTRTQHRMAVNIEDAGFDIRDMIAWVYGSGFPKGKSCLKPALEPITMARKRAKKVQPLNIDGCRVGTEGGCKTDTEYKGGDSLHCYGKRLNDQRSPSVEGLGRWPANLIHDGSDEVTELFPHTTSGKPSGVRGASKHNVAYADIAIGSELTGYGDSGSAARFFYCPKANKKDRDGSTHPTMKPTDLMAYLCRLVTPPGGIVLDPFMGSGSTGKAAVREGFRFIGIERDEEYYAIAEQRVK